MAAEKKASERKTRTRTERGLGAVRPTPRTSGVGFSDREVVSGTRAQSSLESPEEPAGDAEPFATRATMPAPPSLPPEEVSPSGPRPRIGLGSGAPRSATNKGFAPPPPSGPPPAVLVPASVAVSVSAPPLALSLAPTSAPPSGRYSARPEDVDVVSVARARDTLRAGAQRVAVRVDEVGPTMIVARQDAARDAKPRVVSRTQAVRCEVAGSEAFILSLVRRAITVPDLVDAAGMPEHEVMRVLSRLTRRGLVTVSR